MNVLAIITARGGSKGLPGKNIKKLADKPLLAWVIEAANASKEVTRTIVSTDDEEIASVARKYDVAVPFMRPSQLAEDLSTTHEVLVHALDWLAKHEGYKPEIVLLLPPTAPLVLPIDIDKGIRTLRADEAADSVRPVIESPKHPYKTLAPKDGYLVPFFSKEVVGHDEPYDLPRQLFPPAYVYSGAFQVIRSDVILEQKSLSGKKMAYMLMPANRSVNIDSLDDFEFADMLMRRRTQQQEDKTNENAA